MALSGVDVGATDDDEDVDDDDDGTDDEDCVWDEDTDEEGDDFWDDRGTVDVVEKLAASSGVRISGTSQGNTEGILGNFSLHRGPSTDCRWLWHLKINYQKKSENIHLKYEFLMLTKI